MKDAESTAVLEFVQDHVLAAARPVSWPEVWVTDVTLRRALKVAQAIRTRVHEPAAGSEAHRVRSTPGDVSFMASG